LLFAPAEADIIDGVIYWALIDDIEITPSGTRVKFSQLRPLAEKQALHTLIKLRTGTPLSDNYIRPYVSCRTPDFIFDLDDGSKEPLREHFAALCVEDCPPSVLADKHSPDGFAALKLRLMTFVRDYLRSEPLSAQDRLDLRASLEEFELKVWMLDLAGRMYLGKLIALAWDVLKRT
jgi:hypothetical protein